MALVNPSQSKRSCEANTSVLDVYHARTLIPIVGSDEASWITAYTSLALSDTQCHFLRRMASPGATIPHIYFEGLREGYLFDSGYTYQLNRSRIVDIFSLLLSGKSKS